jgi:ABC-type transport system involved in multi-copper enzyme maturation permease subunit
MVVARIIGVIVLIAIAVAVIMWLFTRESRYLWFAYRLIQLTVLAGVVFFGIFFLERVL